MTSTVAKGMSMRWKAHWKRSCCFMEMIGSCVSSAPFRHTSRIWEIKVLRLESWFGKIKIKRKI